jgi:hypothetical protein
MFEQLYTCTKHKQEIAISDNVYRRLKPQKGDRSFSEVTEGKLDTRNRIADIAEQRDFEPGTGGHVSEDIGRLSEECSSQMLNTSSQSLRPVATTAAMVLGGPAAIHRPAAVTQNRSSDRY